MKKITAFGASNSQNSINKRLVSYAVEKLKGFEIEILDLNDFDLPIYSIDRESNSGIPELAHIFKDKLNESDGIIISFAEHNGAYTVAYKNIYDWASRIEKNFWKNKPLLLLSTSPGSRGAKGVLELAYGSYKRSNDNLVDKFSLPFFNKNFDPEIGILDDELEQELVDKLIEFKECVLNFDNQMD